LYRRKPKAQLRRFFSLDWARPRVGNGMEGLKARPAFQKALASMAAVALVVGVCFAVPALLGQSPVALAEELVADDAGVQILLAEEGFDLSDLRKVALKSDEGNIYQVHLINPKDEVPMGTVTVDVDQRMVTRVEFLASSKEYVQSFAPIGMMTMEGVVEGMSGDARVRELLDGGAEVGKASCFSSLSSPQRQMAGLELRLGDKVWLVEVDPNGGEVMSMSERHR